MRESLARVGSIQDIEAGFLLGTSRFVVRDLSGLGFTPLAQ